MRMMDEVFFITQLAQMSFTVVGGYIIYRLTERDKQRMLEMDEREQKEIEERKESRAIRDGLCAVLRDRLMMICLECEKKGYVEIKAMENLDHLYRAYSGLGGNGVVRQLYEAVRLLPHTPQEGE
jgi:hypothetical protein